MIQRGANVLQKYCTTPTTQELCMVKTSIPAKAAVVADPMWKLCPAKCSVGKLSVPVFPTMTSAHLPNRSVLDCFKWIQSIRGLA